MPFCNLSTPFFKSALLILSLIQVHAQLSPVNLDCPDTWTDGEKETLTCIIDESKFTQTACSTFEDSVSIYMKKNGIKTPICKVQPLKSSNCAGTLNSDGCGCQKRLGVRAFVVYSVTANKGQHGGAVWSCEPKCLNGAGEQALESTVSETCNGTKFDACTPSPCKYPQQACRHVNYTTDGYECFGCTKGHYGANCEIPDPCDPNPCKAGVQCSRVDGKATVCYCPFGYKGNECAELSGAAIALIIICAMYLVAFLVYIWYWHYGKRMFRCTKSE